MSDQWIRTVVTLISHLHHDLSETRTFLVWITLMHCWVHVASDFDICVINVTFVCLKNCWLINFETANPTISLNIFIVVRTVLGPHDTSVSRRHFWCVNSSNGVCFPWNLCISINLLDEDDYVTYRFQFRTSFAADWYCLCLEMKFSVNACLTSRFCTICTLNET